MLLTAAAAAAGEPEWDRQDENRCEPAPHGATLTPRGHPEKETAAPARGAEAAVRSLSLAACGYSLSPADPEPEEPSDPPPPDDSDEPPPEDEPDEPEYDEPDSATPAEPELDEPE